MFEGMYTCILYMAVFVDLTVTMHFNGLTTPQTALFLRGSGSPPNTCFSVPNRVFSSKRKLIRSAVFLQLTVNSANELT